MYNDILSSFVFLLFFIFFGQSYVDEKVSFTLSFLAHLKEIFLVWRSSFLSPFHRRLKACYVDRCMVDDNN